MVDPHEKRNDIEKVDAETNFAFCCKYPAMRHTAQFMCGKNFHLDEMHCIFQRHFVRRQRQRWRWRWWQRLNGTNTWSIVSLCTTEHVLKFSPLLLPHTICYVCSGNFLRDFFLSSFLLVIAICNATKAKWQCISFTRVRVIHNYMKTCFHIES